MFLTAEWFWEGENVNPVDRGVGGAAWRQPESTCLPAGRAYTRVKHLNEATNNGPFCINNQDNFPTYMLKGHDLDISSIEAFLLDDSRLRQVDS